jgi:hypothetical protein
MASDLDFDKIAEGIGAERKGKVTSGPGFFGALQLAAEVSERFRIPPGGGRATNPHWTERRLVPFAPETLEGLDNVATVLHVSRLQAAGLILEQALKMLAEDELVRLASGELKSAQEVMPPPTEDR